MRNRASTKTDHLFDIGGGPMAADARILDTGQVPNSYYLDQDQYDREIDLIFRCAWLKVARSRQVASSGSFLVKDVLGTSILVTRARDGVVRAFHNACTHRSAKLVWEERGRRPSFICPYHAWCFDAKGALTHVPDQESFSSLDPAALGLREIRCETWGPFVFINFDPAPKQSLSDFLGDWGTRHEGIPFDEFPRVGRLTGTYAANWKLGVEAGVETYHAFQLHKYSLGHLIPKSNPFFHPLTVDYYGPHSVYTTALNPDFELPENAPMLGAIAPMTMPINARPSDADRPDEEQCFATHPGINFHKSDDFSTANYIVFPNMLMVLSANGWHTAEYWPISRTETRFELEFSFAEATSRNVEIAQAYTMMAVRDTILEDFGVQLSQQKMLATGAVETLHFNRMGEALPRWQAACISAIVDEKAPLAEAAE